MPHGPKSKNAVISVWVASIVILLSQLFPLRVVRAQAADPTNVKLVNRGLSVDDPDSVFKTAATYIVNQLMLTPVARGKLMDIAYERLQKALDEWNRIGKYGTATLYLKGGLALKHYYEVETAHHSIKSDAPVKFGQPVATACDEIFATSDIDFGVSAEFAALHDKRAADVPTLVKDVWMSAAPELEHAYELLNEKIMIALGDIRNTIAGREGEFLLPEDAEHVVSKLPLGVKLIKDLNTDFNDGKGAAFLNKWKDYQLAGIEWIGALMPAHIRINVHHADSSQTGLVDGDNQVLTDSDPNLWAKLTLPDRMAMPGPGLRLMYAFQKGTSRHSIYMTSNYTPTWLSDPSVNTNYITKFALHRLKLVIPFALKFNSKDEFIQAFIAKRLRNELKADGTVISDHLYGVGGELVDVGVDHPIATLSHPHVGLGDLQAVVGHVYKVVSLPWLLDDFVTVLFDGTDLPWVKTRKYEKRLLRFMCLTLEEQIAQKAKLTKYLACLNDNLGAADTMRQCALDPAGLTDPVMKFYKSGVDYNLAKKLGTVNRADEANIAKAKEYLSIVANLLDKKVGDQRNDDLLDYLDLPALED